MPRKKRKKLVTNKFNKKLKKINKKIKNSKNKIIKSKKKIKSKTKKINSKNLCYRCHVKHRGDNEYELIFEPPQGLQGRLRRRSHLIASALRRTFRRPPGGSTAQASGR